MNSGKLHGTRTIVQSRRLTSSLPQTAGCPSIGSGRGSPSGDVPENPGSPSRKDGRPDLRLVAGSKVRQEEREQLAFARDIHLEVEPLAKVLHRAFADAEHVRDVHVAETGKGKATDLVFPSAQQASAETHQRSVQISVMRTCAKHHDPCRWRQGEAIEFGHRRRTNSCRHDPDIGRSVTPHRFDGGVFVPWNCPQRVGRIGDPS